MNKKELKGKRINKESIKSRIKKRHFKSWQRPTFPPGDPAVLSAMESLTTRFEMGLGISSPL